MQDFLSASLFYTLCFDIDIKTSFLYFTFPWIFVILYFLKCNTECSIFHISFFFILFCGFLFTVIALLNRLLFIFWIIFTFSFFSIFRSLCRFADIVLLKFEFIYCLDLLLMFINNVFLFTLYTVYCIVYWAYIIILLHFTGHF